jgi:hypothetical protein
LSVTELWPGKPAPEHSSLYVCAADPWSCTVAEPEVAMAPDQAPLAEQDEAFEDVQVTVALCPGMTELGLRFILIVVGNAGCVGGTMDFDPLLQPERTKAEKRRTAGKEISFPGPVGSCITPPFHMNSLELMLD